jgi:hypothetical protein
MIIRLLMGLIAAPLAAIGALYGLSMVIEPSAGASATAPEPTLAESGFEPEEKPVGEPPLELPYSDGEAAAFLASALAGTQPQWIRDVDSLADLASFSAQIAEPLSGGEADCAPSHVMLACTLRRADGFGYSFGLQQGADGGWVVVEDEVRLLNNS